MDKALLKAINYRRDLLLKWQPKFEEKLKSLPEGRLKIRHVGKQTYYFHVDNNSKEKPISRNNKELIKALCQKDYLEKVVKAIKKELAALKKIEKLCDKLIAEELYGKLNDDRKLLTKPIVPTDDQYKERWLSQPYRKKPISDDVPYFKTMNGELVRSKSEMIIADRLYLNNIPYKYECPALVGDEIIHPDFTILRMSDRKILYYEHCGRMDDPDYAEDMVSRANEYSLAGIIQGDRLFYTFETSKTPLNVSVLDNLINCCFK